MNLGGTLAEYKILERATLTEFLLKFDDYISRIEAMQKKKK